MQLLSKLKVPSSWPVIRSGGRQQAFNSAQSFPSSLVQGWIGSDQVADHLPGSDVEGAFGWRAHRQGHGALGAETDSLRRRFLPRPYPNSLCEHVHRNGFVSCLELPVATKTIQIFQRFLPGRGELRGKEILSPRIGRAQVCMEIPASLSSKFRHAIARKQCSRGTIGESNCALGEAHRIVHSAVMSPEKSGLTTVRPRVRIATFFPPPKISKRHRCEQVAAVCYRIRRSGIEFLLVQTRGGRWTFPKGGIEPGLTHAQAAALEAFEEAGVHGRMEESSFTHYSRKRADIRGSSRSPKRELVVNAHLCEVLRLGPPQESNRNPTWFSAQRAKRRLQEDRKPEVGAELARVVEFAIARIQQLREPTPDGTLKDALQKVQFENVHLTDDPVARASFLKYIRARRNVGPSTAIELAVKAYLGQVLSLDRVPHFNQGLVQVPVKTAKQRAGWRNDTETVRSPVQVIEIDNYPGSHAQNIASRNEGKKPRS